MALEPVGAQGDFGDEARGRFRLARFIMEAGVKLGLGSLAVATACAAFHRWARAAGPGAPHDPHLMAAAAIFLAAKAQGTPLRARDVLNVTHRLLHPGQPPPGPEGGFWGLRDSLVQCELLLLRVLRFRVPVAHPHKYLVQYLLALGRWGGRRGGWGPRRVPGVSWALVRDGAAGGLALRHPPQHLAAAALHLALALCGRHPPPGAPPRWWQVLSPGLGPSELERILRELLALYSLDATVVAPPPDRQTDAPPPDTHTPTAPPDFPAGTPVADRRTDTQRQQADRDPPGGEGRTEPPRD
ncbi:cyclin-Q isoform X1 [Phaenicophaeus curvirostris]|uniref:cyclin-Q isoform X1 n=1 Tax=Phaenicophaeus curvirostris TaxID=33595 RepID=UPI0037F0A15F